MITTYSTEIILVFGKDECFLDGGGGGGGGETKNIEKTSWLYKKHCISSMNDTCSNHFICFDIFGERK